MEGYGIEITDDDELRRQIQRKLQDKRAKRQRRGGSGETSAASTSFEVMMS